MSRPRVSTTFDRANAELRRYYRDCGFEGRQAGWCTGYELGIAMPPDWVDEFNFSYDEDLPDDVVWEEGIVGNFETLWDTGLIDTFVIEQSGARNLVDTSRIPFGILVCEG